MKKIISALIISVMFLSGFYALAQTTDLPDPGTTPDNPLYFLKRWKEQIQLFFIFNDEKKAKQFLHLTDVRLAEYQRMLERGKTQVAQRALEKYQKQLDRALQKAEELKTKKEMKKERVEQVGGEQSATTTPEIKKLNERHIQVLQKNLEVAPEAAKQGLMRALENAERFKSRVREKLEKN